MAKCVRHNNVAIMLVGAFLVGLVMADTLTKALDNDTWWLLATGRQIVQDGFFQENPWSMHQGLHVVVQQWLSAVVLYKLYVLGGEFALKALVAVQIVALTVVLYRLMRLCSGRKRGSGELFALAIPLAYVSLCSYFSTRPHLYTMLVFSLVVMVLERYRRKGGKRVLLALPVLVAVHVNLHAAMAPYDLFIVALYAVPNVPRWLKKRFPAFPLGFARARYRHWPVLAALAACAVAMLLNPYGIDGALYLVKSYGAAGYRNYISEMGATTFWTSYGVGTMACVVLGSLAVGRAGLRKIDFPLTVLFAVGIPLAMMSVRNVWLTPLFCLPLAAPMAGSMSLNPPKLQVFRNKAVCGVLSAALCVTLACICPLLAKDTTQKDSSSMPLQGIAFLDSYVAENGLQKQDVKIYNSFNCGSYLEWRGYKVFMDPRPELWEPGITGVGAHYFQEFVDAERGGKSLSERLLETYQFDVLFVANDSNMAKVLQDSEAYEKGETGVGYAVYVRAKGAV